MKHTKKREEDFNVLEIFEQEIHKVEQSLEDIDQFYKKDLKRLDRLSDSIADIGGSWAFISIFVVVILMWVILNVFLLTIPFDRYPFTLLNLFLSMVAAIQAPIILMAQNRAAKRDQARAELDLEKDLRDLRIDQQSHNILLDLHKDVKKIKKRLKVS